MDWKKLLQRKEIVIIIVGLVFVVALFMSNLQIPANESSTSRNEMEERLRVVLSRLPGVGEVEVMVTFESPAGFSSNSDVVKGVIVLAEGGGEIGVKLTLLQAIHTVLQVPVDKIEVFSLAEDGILKGD